MDDGNLLASKLDEDSMTGNVDTEMVPLDQMKMNVDEARHLKEFVMAFRDEEKKVNEIEDVSNKEGLEEEAKNDENPKVEVSFQEDSEEEINNAANPEQEVNIEEDPEEEVKIDENPNEELIIMEEVTIEEDPEEEVKNDENPNEELIIIEDPEEELKNDENPKEEVKKEAKNERISEAISKNKVSKLRKRSKLLQKKKVDSTSKLGKDGWVSNVDTGVTTLKPVKLNGDESNMVLGVKEKFKRPKIFGDGESTKHEIGEVSNEANTREEEHNEGDTRNEAKAKENLEANSKKIKNKFRKIYKIKKKALRGKNELVVKNRQNPDYSKKKTTMKDKSTGMIFMCSSKTKKDCYHYQVLGLPAGKRDIVFEIYEGMKLFLFDYDLKLMYGIYEAAAPGGYNIEPKAFESAFPSQVRFTVLEDCLPLAEEKFKNVIKDNYYSKNKFHCQLNSKQVKNLCKLLSVASKSSTSGRLQGSHQPEPPTFVDYQLKWTHGSRKAESPQTEAPTFVDSESRRSCRSRKAECLQVEAPTFVGHSCKRPRRSKKAGHQQTEAPSFAGHKSKRLRRRRNAESRQDEASTSFVGRKSKRPQRSRKAETRTFVDPKSKRLHQGPRTDTQEFLYRDSMHHRWEDERRHVFARDCLYSKDLVTYESPVQHPSLCPPLHLPLGSALHPSERDDYRRDLRQYCDLQPLDVKPRHRDEFEHCDSYTIPLLQDNFDHRGSYIASRRGTSYHHHDPSSSARHQSEYYPLASRMQASNYHLSAGPPPDYRPHRPAYQY